MAKIDALFKIMFDHGASDLHLPSGQKPTLRLRGEMERIEAERSVRKGVRQGPVCPVAEDPGGRPGVLDYSCTTKGAAEIAAPFFI